MELVSIYSIADKRTGIVYYVGATMGTLRSRLIQHMSNSELPFFKDDEVEPMIERLEAVEEEHAAEAEQYWIEQIRQWGFPLQNSKNRRYRKPQGLLAGHDDIIQINSARVPKSWMKKCLARVKIKGYTSNGFYIAKLAMAMCEVIDILGEPGTKIKMTDEKMSQLQNFMKETHYI